VEKADRVRGHDIDFIDFSDFDNYVKMLNACDLYVVPSRWEGFGMVVLEAWACGVPVIGTNVGGIPEIIEPGTNGALAEPEPDKLAGAIRSVIEDATTQAEFIKNARAKLEDYFTWSRARRQWMELYSEASAVKN
jgi:glycosyltransferase involved in cell wall biosynthesis